MFTSQTAYLHLQDLGLEVGPDFLRIVKTARTFRKFSVVLSNSLVPETADIQPNLAGWRRLVGLEPYFLGSHENYVVGLGKFGAPKDTAVVDKSPATAYTYMVDLFPCTSGIGIPSPAVQVWSQEPRSSYPQSPTLCEVKEH